MRRGAFSFVFCKTRGNQTECFITYAEVGTKATLGGSADDRHCRRGLFTVGFVSVVPLVIAGRDRSDSSGNLEDTDVYLGSNILLH